MSRMSDGKIFNHAELEEGMRNAREEAESREINRSKKFMNSLDSDEEDDEVKAQKYNVLDPNEFEGQEDGTIDYDGEIKITPFNMKEELEEGYFDKEGTYIFKKDSDVVKDQWLDDIDWIKVKSIENIKRKQNSDEDSDEDLPQVNLKEHYTKMLELMNPKETVQKAICRLGGSKSSSRSASSRWKKKKESNDDKIDAKDEENYEKLQLLTSLANDIVQSGGMDIYQQTYEKLSFHVNTKGQAESKEKKTFGASNDDDALDMFGDNFDEDIDDVKKKSLEADALSASPNAETADSEFDVMWEFKWEASDEAKVYGPYPTSQMLQWVQEKYFESGVLVRQVGKQDGQFYSSKRIDFELYL